MLEIPTLTQAVGGVEEGEGCEGEAVVNIYSSPVSCGAPATTPSTVSGDSLCISASPWIYLHSANVHN